MTDEELDRQLTDLFERRRAARGEPAREARAFGARTPECPPLPLFDAARRGRDWVDAERAHIVGCAYCRRMLAVAQRVEGEGPPRVIIILTARPRAAGFGGARGDGGFTAQPAESGAWELVPPESEIVYTEDDEPAFLLPPEVSVRAYGLPDGERQRVALLLHAERDEATGDLRPQVEVRPAPRLAPLSLEVTFPTGDSRVFVVAVPASPRPATRSEPAEPLSPSAFGPGAGDTGLGWGLGVEFRRLVRPGERPVRMAVLVPAPVPVLALVTSLPFTAVYSTPLDSPGGTHARAGWPAGSRP